MGGFMSWLWIIQAFLIGILFLAGNYYLWIGMGRIPGAERFQPYIKWMLLVLVLGVIVWATPNTMIADRDEIAAMGGIRHPFLQVLGVMSAKNTAVNLMILTTFLSFLMYRRANKDPVVPWARAGTMLQGAAFALSAVVVVFYGVYGYFVTAIVRIGFSVYQVLAVLATILFVIGIDMAMLRGAKSRGEIRWGRMPDRSQYALLILAVTFTWLMGLMGFAPQRDPAALARLRSDPGHERTGVHAGAGPGGDDHQHLRAHLLRARRLHLLARRTGRTFRLPGGRSGSERRGRACGARGSDAVTGPGRRGLSGLSEGDDARRG